MSHDLRKRLPAALLSGAVAGGIATVAMTGVMFGAKRAGLIGEMPPEKITARLLDRFGWGSRSHHTQNALASITHLGFGAAAGSLFGVLKRCLRIPGPPVLSGLLFGASLWLVSYQGWVPALGIMAPPEKDRQGRPQAMLLAHLVYGVAIGALVGRGANRRPPAASA